MRVTARKTRQVLGAMFFGALIGATLMAIAILRSPHGHSDTGYAINAQVTCAIIDQNPTPEGVVKSIQNLKALGYDISTATGVFEAAIYVYCPRYMPLVEMTYNMIKDGVYTIV